MSRVIDPRGRMICNIGPMLRGGLSRDHVKDAWVLKHQGDLELIGVHSLRRGTRVQLAYQWRGGLTRFPVMLYVLSASTTPYGRSTRVKVGCRFKLLEDRTSPIPYTVKRDVPRWYWTMNSSLQFLATPVLSASGLLKRCADGLGMKISPASVEIKGNILRQNVSFSEGYVKVLADLLYSHSCYAYPDPADRLVIKRIPLRGGGGPMFDHRYIIDLTPAGNSDAGSDTVRAEFNAAVLSPTIGSVVPDGLTPSANVVAASIGEPRYWGFIPGQQWADQQERAWWDYVWSREQELAYLLATNGRPNSAPG